MNNFRNFQNTCLLCKITENRFENMQKSCGFNPKRYSSASTSSGCIERDLPKLTDTLQLIETWQKSFKKL